MAEVRMTAPNQYAAEQQAIENQRRLAELLQQQSMQPLSPHTASGPLGTVNTPMSWAEGLAKLMQAYAGRKGQDDVLGQQKALGERYASDQASNLAKGLSQFRGTPEQTEIMPMDEQANGGLGAANQPIVTPAQAPNQDAAMGTWAQHPANAGMAQALLAQMLKEQEPVKLRQGEVLKKGDKVIAGNAPKASEHVINGKVYRLGPDNKLQEVGGPGVAPDPNKPFDPATGAPQVGYQQYQEKLKQLGAPRTTVSVDTKAEGAYATKVSGEAAERDTKQYEAATNAVPNIQKLNGVIDHLKTSDAITGMGADVLKNVERAKVLLANDKKAGKKVSDTEYLDALLGSDVFPMIQQLGIGARGMDTPAEREYLRSVMTGTVPMNKQTLIRMTEIRRDIAKRAVEKWNTRVKGGEVEDFFKYSKVPKSTIQYEESKWSVVK